MTALPALLDCRALMAELGVKRGAAESLMRKLPKTRIGRRVFVRRDDVLVWLRENETDRHGFPLRKTA